MQAGRMRSGWHKNGLMSPKERIGETEGHGPEGEIDAVPSVIMVMP